METKEPSTAHTIQSVGIIKTLDEKDTMGKQTAARLKIRKNTAFS
jgi:hypothetical protein